MATLKKIRLSPGRGEEGREVNEVKGVGQERLKRGSKKEK